MRKHNASTISDSQTRLTDTLSDEFIKSLAQCSLIPGNKSQGNKRKLSNDKENEEPDRQKKSRSFRDTLITQYFTTISDMKEREI